MPPDPTQTHANPSRLPTASVVEKVTRGLIPCALSISHGPSCIVLSPSKRPRRFPVRSQSRDGNGSTPVDQRSMARSGAVSEPDSIIHGATFCPNGDNASRLAPCSKQWANWAAPRTVHGESSRILSHSTMNHYPAHWRTRCDTDDGSTVLRTTLVHAEHSARTPQKARLGLSNGQHPTRVIYTDSFKFVQENLHTAAVIVAGVSHSRSSSSP